MNKRQKIKKLKNENEFLHKIIKNNPEMEDLLHRWTQPVNVIHANHKVEKYKAKMILPHFSPSDKELLDMYKRELLNEICKEVERHVDFEIKYDRQIYGDCPIVEASIFLVDP